MEPHDSSEVEQQIESLIHQFGNDRQLPRGDAYSDGETHSLFGRLQRAAINQSENGEATVSRYSIWANTVRDHIAEALRLWQDDAERTEIERLLVHAHNSLSAFSEIQSLFDRNRGGDA